MSWGGEAKWSNGKMVMVVRVPGTLGKVDNLVTATNPLPLPAC